VVHLKEVSVVRRRVSWQVFDGENCPSVPVLIACTCNPQLFLAGFEFPGTGLNIQTVSLEIALAFSNASASEGDGMKRQSRIALLLLVFFPVVAVQLFFAQAKKLPTIVILATGGTIAGVGASGTQAAYSSGAVGIDTMVAAVPGIREIANIKGEQISNVGSQDMTFAIMLRLATRINALLAQNDVSGIVVTHGTDTMEETAYFLNLVVKSDKPVVLVGSMRPSTAVSADGPLNLFNAVGVAADPQAAGRGVLVVMNDWIHGAHSLTKTNTTAVQTFMSPVRGLVGVANYGKNDYYNRPAWKHTTASEFDVASVTQLPRVDIIYAYSDMPGDLIDSSVANGAKGIVIAGVGNGNMNKACLEAAATATKKGVVVVRSSRVVTGTVGRNVEVNDDEMNFVASDELNPQKARILLILALLKPRTTAEIQNLFNSY
jgi:L-asparaginase